MDCDYAVCEHVLFHGAPIAQIWAETDNAPAEICCEVCAKITQAMYYRTAAGQA